MQKSEAEEQFLARLRADWALQYGCRRLVVDVQYVAGQIREIRVTQNDVAQEVFR